jgi:hypothetical protein
MPGTFKLDKLLSVTISAHRDRPKHWTGEGEIFFNQDPGSDLGSVRAEGGSRQQAESRALAMARSRSAFIRRRL